MTRRLVYRAARYGICEMLLAGVTTFLDMYYFEDQAAEACDKAGMRGILGETVIGQKTCDSAAPYGGLAYGEDFIQKWAGHPRITPMVCPHATNTSSPEYLQKTFAMCEKYDTLFTLHASEMDFRILYAAIRPHNMNYVVAIDAMHDNGIGLMRFAGGIGKRKFIQDMHLIRNMKYCVDELKNIICVYPEARYTFDGTQSYIPPSVGKMAKLLKVPVVLLIAEGKQPLDGSHWTTAKLSTLLRNPIYVRADSDIYDYYDRHGTQITTDLSLFTGEYGAQLYGHTKHDSANSDWSDMKLVLLTHPGLVDSDIWLKCQRKLEKNRQITNSYSNPTSWLAGKVICEQCGHTMTTIKGKPNQSGEVRRYFNCTGKSHKKICPGPKGSVYAEDLENMVYECIAEKLADLKQTGHRSRNVERGEINDLKLKIKAIEQQENQLLDTMLTGGFNNALLAIANQKATQLKQDRLTLYARMEELSSRKEETDVVINLADSWQTADYQRKKAVAMIVIHKILIREDGSIQIIWNL